MLQIEVLFPYFNRQKKLLTRKKTSSLKGLFQMQNKFVKSLRLTGTEDFIQMQNTLITMYHDFFIEIFFDSSGIIINVSAFTRNGNTS